MTIQLEILDAESDSKQEYVTLGREAFLDVYRYRGTAGKIVPIAFFADQLERAIGLGNIRSTEAVEQHLERIGKCAASWGWEPIPNHTEVFRPAVEAMSRLEPRM